VFNTASSCDRDWNDSEAYYNDKTASGAMSPYSPFQNHVRKQANLKQQKNCGQKNSD
jgi:hypothetical protein